VKIYKNLYFVNKGNSKMAKSKRKKQKGIPTVKRAEKNTKDQTKATEYVSNLLQLHKLQGVLLNRLNKEIS